MFGTLATPCTVGWAADETPDLIVHLRSRHPQLWMLVGEALQILLCALDSRFSCCLNFCTGIVDVDGRDQQLASTE